MLMNAERLASQSKSRAQKVEKGSITLQLSYEVINYINLEKVKHVLIGMSFEHRNIQ